MGVDLSKWVCGALLAMAVGAPAQSTGAGREPQRFVVEAIASERAAPDIYYLLMKMDYEAARTSEAATGGEKRLREFLGAVEALKVPGLTWRVANIVITPDDFGPGVTYTRNIVFTLPAEAVAANDPLIARLEDLGARFNSHCVTCIGSG
jgi:hypothetical protein